VLEIWELSENLLSGTREHKYGREHFNTLRTGDADLRFYITAVQDE